MVKCDVLYEYTDCITRPSDKRIWNSNGVWFARHFDVSWFISHNTLNQKCRFLMDEYGIKWTIFNEMKSHLNHFGWKTAKNNQKYENYIFHWIHFNYWSFDRPPNRISRKVHLKWSPPKGSTIAIANKKIVLIQNF